MYEAPHVTRSLLDGVAVVAPVGEFDLQASEQLRSELEAAVTTMSPCTVVDLSRTTFLDSSGIGALVVAGRLAEQHEGWIRLVAAQGSVRRLLRLTQVDTVLALYDDLAHAVGDIAGASLTDGGEPQASTEPSPA